MKIGILGFAGAGKKSLFRLLTGVDAATRKGPVVPGVARVHDPRVDALAAIFRPERVKHAEIEFLLLPDVEIGGTKGASWLQAVTDADALAVVVRDFEDPSVFHPRGAVDPLRDARELETEFILADLALVETRLERIARDAKHSKDPRVLREKDHYEAVRAHLEAERPLRAMDWDETMEAELKHLGFLSRRAVVVVQSTDREEPRSGRAESGFTPEVPAVRINVKLELEIAAIDDPEERSTFLRELGIAEPAIAVFTRAAYESAGLISFFTVESKEVRAWTVKRGTLAPRAAGKIHTDMERGFIRAEVARAEDVLAAGSAAEAKAKSLWHLKGKDYEVQDGDVLHVRFSV
jgi:GTP-binding protein YchF